jgi:hypothetical protein
MNDEHKIQQNSPIPTPSYDKIVKQATAALHMYAKKKNATVIAYNKLRLTLVWTGCVLTKVSIL